MNREQRRSAVKAKKKFSKAYKADMPKSWSLETVRQWWVPLWLHRRLVQYTGNRIVNVKENE